MNVNQVKYHTDVDCRWKINKRKTVALTYKTHGLKKKKP